MDLVRPAHEQCRHADHRRGRAERHQGVQDRKCELLSGDGAAEIRQQHETYRARYEDQRGANPKEVGEQSLPGHAKGIL
jgi:hypothetical protein